MQLASRSLPLATTLEVPSSLFPALSRKFLLRSFSSTSRFYKRSLFRSPRLFSRHYLSSSLSRPPFSSSFRSPARFYSSQPPPPPNPPKNSFPSLKTIIGGSAAVVGLYFAYKAYSLINGWNTKATELYDKGKEAGKETLSKGKEKIGEISQKGKTKYEELKSHYKGKKETEVKKNEEKKEEKKEEEGEAKKEEKGDVETKDTPAVPATK